MAVYTKLEFSEIESLVAPLALGRLTAARGIAAGVENTTYFLDFANDDFCGGDNSHNGSRRSSSGDRENEYVLTIVETLSRPDLEFIAMLMHELNAHGLPVPAPAFVGTAFSAAGAVLSVRAKPALLVPRIAGIHPQSASPELCREVGRVLAELHLSTLALGYRHESHRSLSWVAATGQALLHRVDAADRSMLQRELEHLAKFVSADSQLPQAIIHGDLFRDNVLVKGNVLVKDNVLAQNNVPAQNGIAAIIDFFSAGSGYLLFDLAVTVNDWCFDQTGNFLSANYNALTLAYSAQRPPNKEEAACWNSMLRIAAMRFWVSRLAEQLLTGPHAPAGRGKNPLPYRHLLLWHANHAISLSELK